MRWRAAGTHHVGFWICCGDDRDLVRRFTPSLLLRSLNMNLRRRRSEESSSYSLGEENQDSESGLDIEEETMLIGSRIFGNSAHPHIQIWS
jgi:hypothetical protein